VGFCFYLSQHSLTRRLFRACSWASRRHWKRRTPVETVCATVDLCCARVAVVPSWCYFAAGSWVCARARRLPEAVATVTVMATPASKPQRFVV